MAVERVVSEPGVITQENPDGSISTMRQLDRQEVPVAEREAGAPAAKLAEITARQRILDQDARRAEGTESVPEVPSARATAAPPTASDFNVVDCQDEPLAQQDGGFVIDHFRWCDVSFWEVETVICTWKTWFGCLSKREVAHAEFRRSVAGYGYDSSRYRPGDWVPADRNQMYWITLVDQWRNVRGTAPLQPLTLEIICEPDSGVPCEADPLSSTPVTRTIAEWMSDGGWFFRWLEDRSAGAGPDRLAFFTFSVRQTYGATETDTTEGTTIRCDWATYVQGTQGCSYWDVVSIFPISLAPDAKHRKAALHIVDAQFTPDRTQPQVDGKAVPGNPFAPHDQSPLGRLYPDYGPDERTTYNANRATAVRACKAWWGDDYSQGGQFDCDEYPMASTYQGASLANGNYSARVIDATDNGSAGGLLASFYQRDRILHQDLFYVIPTVPSGGGGGGGTPINHAPRVNAGGDVRGAEGGRALLRGSAYDTDDTPSVRWSYTPGADVDAGATCSLGDAGRAATSITCTDDGTFTVTLTADDGVNPPVSDSATVRLDNVAPVLALPGTQTAAADGVQPGPEPWSVYRVGNAVTVTAPFTDQGANDSQTCKVDWDDGTVEQFAATQHLCARDHVYGEPGMYTIKSTLTDDDTGVDNSTTMVVVYDPDGGFETVGGHYASPAGAVIGSPDTTGTMQVTMNTAYRPGDEGPVPSNGKVDATLRNAGFDLRSTTLKWLVVTRDHKSAVMGDATLNGNPGYGFVAYTDDTDNRNAVRLVVWPLSAGPYPSETVIYDNTKADYDIDLARPQPLTAGSVVIHD